MFVEVFANVLNIKNGNLSFTKVFTTFAVDPSSCFIDV